MLTLKGQTHTFRIAVLFHVCTKTQTASNYIRYLQLYINLRPHIGCISEAINQIHI